ncbi:MAG: thiamine pyrophosphate-binding protein [Methanobrevibacter sp.]|jgi:acetolactate synthase-1/2/3 large subunit|nr:thiamine pyrophosphate-binding protein [Candidatus Methanovirga aequatorialis]
MNTAEAMVKILENEGIKFIFGVPGEQIAGFYKALSKSKIKHILCRNEQTAGIAGDVYSRTSQKFGVCVSTAGPGALNLIMGVATAFKDSVPLLIITADVPNSLKGKNTMQDIDLPAIFKPITVKNYDPENGKTAILNLKEAIEIFKKEPRGPIHLNIRKDILCDEDVEDVINEEVKYNPKYDYLSVDLSIQKLKSTTKPLIILGEGVRRSNSVDDVKKLIEKHKIPTVHTYHGNGILDSENLLNFGIIGIRGSIASITVFKDSDLILALGATLNERTLNLDKEELDTMDDFMKKFDKKIIHVNIDKSTLKGEIKINGDVKEFLNRIKNENIFNNIDDNWLSINLKNKDIPDKSKIYSSDGDILKPQKAIETILNTHEDSLIVGDAGSHTSWVLIFHNPSEKGRLINSGGLVPMGYGLPGAIGASIANPGKEVVTIMGDGDLQMNIQDLATIAEHKLPITLFVLNNNQLGIIRQWEECLYNMKPYAVNLENPDFIVISKGYGIEAEKVSNSKELVSAIKKAKSLKKPYLIEIMVSRENIPLPG